MKTIPLCVADIRKIVEKEVQPDYVVLPPTMTFQIALEVDDKLESKISTDDRLANRIFTVVSSIYSDTVKAVVSRTCFTEYQWQEGEDRAVIQQTWQKDVDDYFSRAKDQIIKHAKGEITAWKQTRDDRTDYIIREVIKVSAGTIAMASNVAMAATGAGALSILGAVKSFLKIFQEIYALCETCREREVTLTQHILEVSKSYKNASTKKVVAKELWGSVVDEASSGVAAFFNIGPSTISLLESDFKFFHAKLAGVEIQASEAGKSLNAILDAQHQINEKIKLKISKQMATADYHSKRLPKLKRDLDKLVGKTRKQIEEMEILYPAITETKQRERTYESIIGDLKAKKPGWVEKLELLPKAGDALLGAATTDYHKAAEILDLATGIETDVTELLVEEA